MSPANMLDDNNRTLESFRKLNAELHRSLEKAKQERNAAKNLKCFFEMELAQMTNQLDMMKHDVSDLESSRNELSRCLIELNCFVKRIKNYRIINNIRLSIKDEWLEGLQNRLETLDFTIEQKQEDSSRSIESFTQFTGLNNVNANAHPMEN